MNVDHRHIVFSFPLAANLWILPTPGAVLIGSLSCGERLLGEIPQISPKRRQLAREKQR